MRSSFARLLHHESLLTFAVCDEEKFSSSNRPVRVGLISLGCAKNLVDAEIMLGSLMKSGVEITNDAAQADAVIVNTCSFIDSAQEESVDTILESSRIRTAKNRGQSLIVSGCLPQRFRDELPKLLPEVDAFMGIDQVAQVGDIVRQAMASRAESWPSQKPKVDKGKVVSRLNELEKSRDLSTHEKEPNPSAARTNLAKQNRRLAQSLKPRAQFSMSPSARFSFPILPRRASA
jgi:methylmalonyl-CoA mutase cobalamin-binding subunit